ncbi:MAG: sugar transferase [Patescibacteria group bacterium]|nr:sugar transferase [Patescibacteria group bacterium]
MPTKLIQLKQQLLLGVDLIILYASLFFALLLRYQSEFTYEKWQLHFVPFTIIYIIWIIVFYINGLYDISGAKNTAAFWRTFFESLGINALLAVAIFYLIPALGIAPKTNLFINLGVFALLFFAWRSLYNRFVSSSVLKNRILIIGKNKEAEEIIKIIKDKPQLGYKMVGFISIDKKNGHFSGAVSEYSLADLDYLLFKKKIDTIIVPSSLIESKELVQHLYACIAYKIAFIDFVAFYETLTSKIPVSAVTEHWFLQNLREGEKKFYDTTMVIFDFTFSAVIGIVMLILLPFVALSIKIDDNGPVFYRQKRVGKFGKIFEIVKFRTMSIDAEKDGAQFASEDDDRITRLGKFLRASRIDELPQIINVLRGEMGFFGPRPEQPEFVEKLQEKMPFYTLRHLIKPGLSGWAQINYPYAGTIEENLKKLQYDLFYIKNRSALLDAMILLKTINTLLRQKGI